MIVSAFMFLVLVLAASQIITDEATETKEYNIILIPKTIDNTNDFWTALIEGAKLGGEEFGAKVKVVGGTAEEDYERQNELIAKSVKEKPDALLIAPCSSTYTLEAIEDAVAQGVNVILIDSLVDRDVARGIVATDNFKAGEELGKYAAVYLEPDSKIGVVAHVKGSSTAVERQEGIKAGLGDYKDQLVDTVYCNSSYSRASDLTEQMIRDYPDIDMIIGTNEYSAVGAARAVKKMGLSGRVDVVGFDNSVEEIQFLEAGVFKGIVIQKPFNMGYLGVEQAVKCVQGHQIDYNLDSGCKLITKENMYEQENQRLLYPFSAQQ